MKKYAGAIFFGGVVLLILVIYLGFILQAVLAIPPVTLYLLPFILLVSIGIWYMAEALSDRIQEIKRGEDDDYRDY